jgi:hypothetical protein
MKYKLFIVLFILLAYFSIEETIEIKATSGIINLKYEDNKCEFNILCEVNDTITDYLLNISIYLYVKIYPNEGEDEKQSICHIKKEIEEKLNETYLLCSIDLDISQQLNNETFLVYYGGPLPIPNEEENTTEYEIEFKNFEHISFNINSLTLNNLNEDFCINNNYVFEIITDYNFKEQEPFKATKCNLKLSNDNSHKMTRCIIPVKGKKIMCSIDTSEKGYKEGNDIIIEKQNVICENGQFIQFPNEPSNKLSVTEDCGELIFINNNYLYFNKIFLIFLLIFILF